MQLQDYPRPIDDTGIGVHWSVGTGAALGVGELRQRWLPLLRELGVKWVKIADPEGGMALAEMLLRQEIMPVVRLMRPQPNPGVLNATQLAQLEELLRIGVRYFEFNQEPDLHSEWQGRRMPPNAQDLVAQNACIDMERILERGGMPGVPAVRPGSQWDLVAKILEHGGAALFDGPVWQAVHNFSYNHPLDYPYDAGHQEGAPFSQEFYGALHREEWGGSAWQGRSLQEVNHLRAKYARPNTTILEDSRGWLAYQRCDILNQRSLGRTIPILSTENGYLIGEHGDPRYPATGPALHAAQTLEACRIMMGSSRRYPAAPDYYFCTAFWLLGNYELGNFNSWWEPHAWFSARWPGGKLPIVDALRAEPKRSRLRPSAAATPAPVRRGFSTLGGTIRGGGGAKLRLIHASGQTWETLARPDGSYRFVGLPAGDYHLTLARSEPGDTGPSEPAVTQPLQLNGHNHLLQDLTLPGWGYTVYTQDTADEQGRIRCILQGPPSGMPTPHGARPTVRLSSAARQSPPTVLEPGDGSGSTYEAEIGPLPPGLYDLTLDLAATQLTAQVYVDRDRHLVHFVHTETSGTASGTGSPAVAQSVIAGSAPDAEGRDVILCTTHRGASPPQEVARQSVMDGRFRFQDLAAAEYELTIDDLYHQDGLMVDGRNGLEIRFAPLVHNWVVQVDEHPTLPTFGLVRVYVTGRPHWPVILWSDQWAGETVQGGSQAGFNEFSLEFSPLKPGTYYVQPHDLDITATVRLEAGQTAQVVFKQDLTIAAPPQVELLPRVPTPPSRTGAGTAADWAPATDGREALSPTHRHYLLVGDGAYGHEDLVELIRYVERFDPRVGDDLDEARRAAHVTILGDDREGQRRMASALMEAGIQVDQITGDFARILAERTDAGNPW